MSPTAKTVTMGNERNRWRQSASAEELRERMQTIRQNLAPEVDEIVSTAGQLTNWRYYVRTFPWASVAIATALGYFAVPRKLEIISPDEEVLRKLAKRNRLVVEHKPGAKAKPGLIETVFNLTGNLLLRAGVSYLGQRLGQVVSQDGAQTSETRDVEQP